MRFGATSLQISSVLAKGLRRPKLRSDLRISGQTVGGEKSYVIKIHETSSYNRYGVTEYELLTLCDGTRTPAELAEELTRRHPNEPLAESEVLDFLDGIEPAMWERSVGEKNLAVLERIRDERKARLKESSVLYLTFKAWDPNQFLAKIDPYLRWLFTPGAVVGSLILCAVSAYLMAGDWTRIAADTVGLYTFQNKTAYDIWVFWFLMLGLGGIHELGHGLTCKHFGGDVHQMGFMLIYFTPAFYTDTTDIVLFERGSRRLWVIFAGIWVELTLCAISTLVWHFTAPGSIANDLAYKAMLLSGIEAALVNLNPLIKADGYYALGQFLNVDNLREDSFAFLRAAARKYLLREDIDLPAVSRRLRRIYMIFGVAAVVYSATLLVFVLGFVRNILVEKFGTWGHVLTLALIYFVARKGLQQAVPQVRNWLRENREAYMAWKMSRAQLFGAAGVLVLLLVPPLPSSVSTDFTLEAGRETRARAKVPGMIRQVLVREGDQVEAGQILAVLDNPEVSVNQKQVAQELSFADAEVRSAEERPEANGPARALRQRLRLQQESAVAQRNAELLRIRAPYRGVVSTPNMEQKLGEYLYAGDEFCQIVDRDTMKARVLVRDWELGRVPSGAEARMKVRAFPFRTYRGMVEQILPAAATDQPVSDPQRLARLGQQLTNYFALVVEFPNSDRSLREGMTGTAKIAAGNSPLLWRAGRGFWRWVRSQAW
jgi:putative peptide zinc metalloprotease protein